MSDAPKSPKRPAAKAAKGEAKPKSARPSATAGANIKTKPPLSLKQRIIRYGALAVFVVAAGVGLYGLMQYRALYAGMPKLPPTAELWTSGRMPAVEFVDRDGETLAIRGPRYGRAVTLEELPPHVYQAFIAAEDKRFYEHDGADTTAIARAAWSNWRSGRTVSGASTITQQVVKNLVLGPEQTIRRKAQEVRLARELETRLSKDEILELYLNRIYFGSSAYGIDAAARHYFGIPPQELSIAQASILASVPQAPSRLALDNNFDEAKERQLYVLKEMVDAGHITDVQMAVADLEAIALVQHEEEPPALGYALDMAHQQVRDMLPDGPGDVIVTLTVDQNLQERIQTVVTARIKESEEELDVSQAAAVVMRPDGAILAMVGGVDYSESKFNRATQARRQPGSAFKPILYAAALANGAHPYDVYYDEPVEFDGWRPRNYVSGAHLGPVTVAESLAESLNTVAATIGDELGEERVIALARSFGIRSELRPLPSIALGSQEVTLLDMVRAYSVFAKEGQRADPFLVLSVHDSRGRPLFTRPDYEAQQVFPRRLARDMTAMLSRVIEDGTGTKAAVPGWSAAGKTGTSQDWRDAWFVGYTATRIAGVWVGNDNDGPMNEVSGGGLPAEIWSTIMMIALEGEERASLAGAGRASFTLSPEATERVGFYRRLSVAFNDIAEAQEIRAASATSQQ
ncbi:MAG: PBP1A family penicillin-binding protein [Pseudomonadota bacterium]